MMQTTFDLGDPQGRSMKWQRRREAERRKRAEISREKAQRAEALAAIRNGARAEVILACIRTAAEVVGVERKALVGRRRGTPAEALARVVAMHACVCRGVPISATAEAFQRTRWAVHRAIEIGRPGGETRDMQVREKLREVLGRLNDELTRPARPGKCHE